MLASVVVPVYNRLPLLRATVASLKSQSLREAEFILVDDGSDAETMRFLTELPHADSRFRIVRKPEVAGRGAQCSRNIGMQLARGEGLVFLDSDDLLAVRSLEERHAQLRAHRDADIIVGRQAVIGIGREERWVNVPDPARKDLDRMLAFSDPIDVPWVNGGVMFRRASLAQAGISWRSEFHWDDVAFHFECLIAGLTTHWPDSGGLPDSFYVQHEGQRYGFMLSTDEGIESTAAMIVWMLDSLARAGLLSRSRGERLFFNFFRECIVRPADRQRYALAGRMIGVAARTSLVNARAEAQLRTYVRGRRMIRSSARATYYWNRFAERVLIRQPELPLASTYFTRPVPPYESTR